jgi:hypothetical protein
VGLRAPLVFTSALLVSVLFMAPSHFASDSSLDAENRNDFPSVITCKQCLLDLERGSISTASTTESRGIILIALYS